MPPSRTAKAFATKLASTPEAKARLKIKRLMRQRSDLVCELREFEDKHSKVLEVLEAYKSDIADLDNQVKDASRALYRDGSVRGIYTLYDDPSNYVKVTVKYGRDTFDPTDIGKFIERNCPDSFDDLIHEVVKDGEIYVDTDRLRELVDEGLLPEEILDLGERGAFQTPAVTIKNKVEESVTVRP